MLIGELAKQTGVSTKTIRYYEKIGILPDAERNPNGYREYNQTDIHRLQLVAGARQLDISLPEIQEILDMRDRREAPCGKLLEIIADKRNEIQQRIEQLKQMDIELERLHAIGKTFPKDDIEGKHCICHLVSKKASNQQDKGI